MSVGTQSGSDSGKRLFLNHVYSQLLSDASAGTELIISRQNANELTWQRYCSLKVSHSVLGVRLHINQIEVGRGEEIGDAHREQKYGREILKGSVSVRSVMLSSRRLRYADYVRG